MSEIRTLYDGTTQIAPRTVTRAITTRDGIALEDAIDAKCDKSYVDGEITTTKTWVTNNYVGNSTIANYSTTAQMNSAIAAHHDSTKYDASNPAGYVTNTEVYNKEDKSNKVTSITSSSTNTEYPSAKAVYNFHDGSKYDASNPSGFITSAAISGKEDSSNKVTSMTSASTDTQYPSAKCVYDEYVYLRESKQGTLSSTQLNAVNSGINSTLVTKYDAYDGTIQNIQTDISDLDDKIDTVEAKITTEIQKLDSSASASSGYGLSSITITDGKITASNTIKIPNDTADLASNSSNYQNGTQVATSISNAVTPIENKLNENVVLHTTNNNITYNGDTVTLTTSYKNLKTGTSNTKTETIQLANATTAGLMSPSDVNTLSDHGSRISALEGTTNRVLYVISSTLGPIGSYPIAFTIKGIIYSINGSIITEHNGASPEPTYTMDAQGNVTIHGIAYTFDVTNMHGERAATQSNIGQFAINEGFVSPFRGVAIVIDETFHIWRYYPNTEGGVVIGWKDDGMDTVNIFTNSSPGVIQGSATDGKVYAENDGTGSVYGWSSLTSRVTAVENRPTNVMTFTSGTTLPSTGSVGQIFFNTSTHLVYIYNGTAFEAMNTYQ